jgi:hypothetical protein
MRKLLILLILAAVLLYSSKTDLADLQAEFGGEYVAYTTEETEKAAFSVGGVTIYEADLNFKNRDGIEGETVTFNGNRKDIKKILHKLYALYHVSDDVDGIYIVYGYSPKLRRTTIIDGRPVNFQITEKDGIITVSNPVNLGEY